MNIFNEVLSFVKKNLKEFTVAQELKRSEFHEAQKIEAEEKLVQVYKENMTRDNMSNLHTHYMKTWEEINKVISDKDSKEHESLPKDVDLQELINSKKAWMVYPMKTKYLQFAKVFFVR
jgi:methionyl-tRNA synthetase